MKTGYEPELSGQRELFSDAPSLGGDRKLCPKCNFRMSTDMFGTVSCQHCEKRTPPKFEAVTRGRLPSDPDWFFAGKTTTACQIIQVRSGRHPMGSNLLNEQGKTCGNCAHLRDYSRASSYFKCIKHAITGGPASDIRKS